MLWEPAKDVSRSISMVLDCMDICTRGLLYLVFFVISICLNQKAKTSLHFKKKEPS